MLEKNATISLKCTALGQDFEGICRHEGQVVFVPGALPGETITARIIKVTKQYAAGKLTARDGAAPDRVQVPCLHFPRCGGCTAQHLAYESTLHHKEQQVRDCLSCIGGVENPPVAPILGMDDPWRYRNKGAFPVGSADGGLRIGCFAARSHEIIDAPSGCLLQSQQSDALVGAVRRWMLENKVPAYKEATGKGLIRHVMTREARNGTAMLILSINGKTVPAGGELIRIAREAAPNLVSIMLSENTKASNVILGDGARVLWGEAFLSDELAGFSLRVSPHTFFQVNRAQAETLYAQAVSMAELTANETVWDVYCGCGSITLPLASRAARAVGVEIVPDAVADAKENARRNGVANASFYAGAAELLLPDLARREGQPDAVVLDPPRKGAERPALDAIIQAAPRRIVYVSCNPATLARDVAVLAEGGYSLAGVQPVDMFPWTGHVECVALLARPK